MSFARSKVRRGFTDADVRRYVAEAIGTFVLVAVGVGSAVLAGEYIGALGVAIAFGLALLVMAYAIGPISGCHINPAVTLGLLLDKRIDGKSAGIYMVAQVIGAIAGAALVWAIAQDNPAFTMTDGSLAPNGYDDLSPGGYGITAALLAEIFLTALLVLTVLAMTSSRAPAGFAPIPIGLVLTGIHLVGIPVTNASINPARSIGPAVIEMGDALPQLWAFILGPGLGAVLAVGIWKLISDDDTAPVSRAVSVTTEDGTTIQAAAAAVSVRRRRNRRR